MNWLEKIKQALRRDDPFDTYTELYLAWIAAMLTLIAASTILYYLFGVT